MDVFVLSFKFDLQSLKVTVCRKLYTKVSVVIDNFNFVIAYLKMMLVE